MMLYTRPQLIVLLLVVLVAGVGLAVGQWRRTHPALAERVERLDRVVPPSDSTPAPSAPPTTPMREALSQREHAARKGSSGPPPAADAPARRGAKTPPAQPVDVNRASEGELRAVPGIGAMLAARIVESREREGPFASLDDLRRVRGLGRSKLERLATSLALVP